MAPQNLNLGQLLTSDLATKDSSSLLPGRSVILKERFEKRDDSPYTLLDLSHHRGRKKRFYSMKPITIDPIKMIQTLLTPGTSAASCNEETLSSSFLILDGFQTISLGSLNINEDEQAYSMLQNAVERWGSRMETNICVGKVCYEYRHDTEEEEEKCLSFSSSGAEDDFTRSGKILSQQLDLVPLVLDDPLTNDIKVINPDRYVPPNHKMVADCLKFNEYDEAAKVSFDILQADLERYGRCDLVCAIDYHNLGVTNLLAGNLDSSLDYFQDAVLLKRACLQKEDVIVADSLTEIGIILYMNGDLKGANLIFHEALEIYVHNNLTKPCSDCIGRLLNNLGCVNYKMGDLNSALLYMQKSLLAQRNGLGLNSKAESALLSCALTQANTGYLKCKSDHLDGVAILEESLLVLESVLGDKNTTVIDVCNNISFAKQM